MDNLQFSNILQIQEASRQGRLVVFVGAGVSNNSGVPTWSTLIQEMKNGCGANQETDELKIAQLFKDARGEKEYLDKVKEVLKYNKVIPNEIHKAILDLNPCHIITTNYDNLIEQEIENEFKQFAIIREDKDMPNMAYPNCLIKMHGDFETNNIVLTESDYYSYGKNYPLIRSYILSLFASKLVVFIGFSFADLNLKMILNDLRSILQDSMQRAYLISDTKPTPILNSYYENKGINVVYLDETDIEELMDSEEEGCNLTNPKGIYLYKVLHCVKTASKNRGKDLASILYEQLKEYKDELPTIGDGLKYLLPPKEKASYYAHSGGVDLYSDYFKTLAKQLKSFEGKRKFILEHPEINRKELKEMAYNNYLFKIDDVAIVDPEKQYELFVTTGNYSALWYFYKFDFNKLNERILYLSTRDLSGDNDDLEYPFLLYKVGNYYEAYQAYYRILPLAWKRRKYIIYFICLYNLWSIRGGVYFTLLMKDEKLANRIKKKIASIKLDEVLSRLPISDGIRMTFQDLLSFRTLGNTAVDTEDKREQIYQQRKSGERGGFSINSNIAVLLSQFERTFQFCNNNYIICDNNDFYKSIGYNTVCGILNSYATPDSNFEGRGIKTSKIDKLFPFCIFTFVYCIPPKKLKEIFRRYEIDSIELTEDAINTINEYWINLQKSNNIPFVDRTDIGHYIENLMYVTAKIKNDGIKQEYVYGTIIKYWEHVVNFKINGDTLAFLLSSLKPDRDILQSLLDKLISNLDKYDSFGSCYEWIAKYMSDFQQTYDMDLSNLKQGKYANELFYLYNVLNPVVQKEFSKYCQNNLRNAWDYMDFIVDNRIDILSIDEFNKKLNSLNNNPSYCKRHCYWKLSIMRKDEHYSNVHSIIDELAQKAECLRFYLNPADYDKKNQVEPEWIIYTTKEFMAEYSQIPEYKQILKKYLIDKKYLPSNDRNWIVKAL